MDYIIIVAGGKGVRMGSDVPKQFLPVKGMPVLMRTISRFHECNPSMQIILVLPHHQQQYWHDLCSQYAFGIAHTVVDGGDTRFASSRNGLAAIPDDATGTVGIHDGVRPFVAAEVINRCYDAARTHGAAIPVMPVTDTLRHIYFVDDVDFELSPLACAYARARGADRMCSYGDFVALSDVCDEATALLIKREVSDGVIAPGYTDEALAVLRDKRKGTYNVIQIDPDYQPAPIERKQVFGITFEQGRNEIRLDDPALFENIPTQNKTFTDEARRDLVIALITLKYTQSNSVCYVKDGQAIGIGAGQQSRIHCTRLAGNKADIWWLRQHPKVMNLPFVDGIRRADRDNTIDVYISEDHEDVLRDGTWQMFFKEKPEVLTMEEKKAWIAQNRGVALGSDAFFPFGDNIERAHKSGVEFIAQAGGSVRDDNVIDTCDKYGIAMAFTGVRLFHH